MITAEDFWRFLILAYEIVSDGGVDALALNERKSPVPSKGEILVGVRASTINYRDLSIIENPVTRGIRFPRTPNSDGAGEVISVGASVRASLSK